MEGVACRVPSSRKTTVGQAPAAIEPKPSYHRVLKANCGEAVNPWWRSLQAIVADHVPRDWPDTSWSPRVRSVPVLRFGFACGELDDAKSGVPIVPLVLISFCWPGMLQCPDT